MKKVITALIVMCLMLLSFRAGQRTDMFLQFLQHGPVKTDAMDSQVTGDADVDVIAKTLFQQASAWNKGDIDAFMTDYWMSDNLRFASGGTVKYGWRTTLDRYKERYPDQDTMGELAFSDLDIKMLSASNALVFGRWKLTRAADTPNGLFTLHMRKENGRWFIVSDHTSSSD